MSEVRAPYGESARARLTRQGQITVPKAVRDALGARPGDELLFEPHEGSFVVRHQARRSVLAYAGIAADSAPASGATGTDHAAAVERAVGDAYREKVDRMADGRGGDRAVRPDRR